MNLRRRTKETAEVSTESLNDIMFFLLLFFLIVSTLVNPNVGRVGMWMVIGSQWFVMTLYMWTLVAPRLFPDREFS